MSFLDSAIGSIGQDLAKTAVDSLSQSTGVNVGGTLGYLFGGGQAQGGDNMAALGPAVQQAFAQNQQQLSLLQAELYQQGKALAALGNQLNGITASLANITGLIQNIQQMLQRIGQEQLFQAWQAVDNEMTVYITAIDSAYATYGNYIAAYATTPTSEVSLLIANILDVNDGPVVGLRAIHNFMMDSGQSRGALQLWSQMVTPLVQQGVLDYRRAVQQYFQYYQKLTYAQLKAANLVMEAYNFNNDPHNAKQTWDQYRAQILAQENTFITWMVPLVYAAVPGGIFTLPAWSSAGINFTTYDAAAQLNPGVQYVRGDANIGDAFYTPSSIFQAAEQLLANLYVTGSADRRIVVHMLYPNGGGINSLLDGLNLPLTPVDSPATVSAASNTRLGSPFPFPAQPGDYWPLYPDQNIFAGNGFYLKRYVFASGGTAGLTDGQYNVANLNGQNGLVGLETYIAQDQSLPPIPFQQDNVVNYVLQVDAANPFDFMNFAAYTTPMIVPGLARGATAMGA